MKALDSLAHSIGHVFSSPSAAQRDEERETRPFFIIVTVVLVFLYGRAVYARPELRQPANLIPFTVLMLVHAALHWLSPRLASGRWGVLYLAVQGALAFVLTVLARDVSTVFGLYGALIGQAVGILRRTRLVAVGIVVYLGLAAINVILLGGWADLSTWALLAGVMTLFIVTYVVLFNRQTEARARAQALLAELETAHRELAEYAARVEDLTLAAERQRMARELHDTLAQGLAGLILQLEAADSHLDSSRPERARAILQQAMTRARVTLSDARRVIDDLRQSAAVSEDLAEAVRAEVNRFAGATGIPCELDLASIPALPDTLREHALRIIAEGLTNMARHAQASHAWVRIACADDRLEIEMRDDGRGFDPTAAASESGHYGLLGMRERARLAGGTLAVESTSGKGTILWLSVPIKAG